jgi:PAS domain S-box-containing protein
MLRRVNRALAGMSVLRATIVLTAVAVVLAVLLVFIMETLFYAAVQPSTLIIAVAVTLLVAAPIVAYSQLLIRQIISSRTKLREARDSLDRSQQHLERAQRVAAIGSVERNLAAGTVEWSGEMYRLFGVARESFALTDANIFGLVHPEDRQSLQKKMMDARKGACPPPTEFRIVRPDGQTRTFLAHVDMVADDAGRASRLMMVFKDVTELRNAEQRRQEIEAQLFHSQKTEAIGTLAGGIAHDVNNMLVPIIAISMMMAKGLPEGSRERKNLETVLRAGNHIRDLVGRILTFSRKEAPTRQTIDLGELVRDSLEMLHASVPSTITIEEEVAAVPALLGDPGQLHQVVTNLVTNAAQAIGDRMGTITVTVGQAGDRRFPDGPSSPEDSVQLSVRDTGCGMSQATIARIFEPFFTTKPMGEGTGLGLSVVHGIVVQHGGRITVESHIGKGTCFSVYLPVADRPAAIRGDDADAAPTPAQAVAG